MPEDGAILVYNAARRRYAPSEQTLDDLLAGGGGTAPPTPYRDLVLADNPLAYYRLGESSGTVMVDSSANGHNGTYNAPVSPVFGLVKGDSDTALDTNNNRAMIANPAWLNVNNLTVHLLLRTSNLITSGGLVTRYEDTTSGAWLLWINNDNKFAARFYNVAGSFVDVVWGTTPALNTTYHLAASYDGTTARLFVNGYQMASSTAMAGNLRPTYQRLGVGYYESNVAWPFNGVVDEVALYDRALLPSRISELSTAAVGASPS